MKLSTSTPRRILIVGDSGRGKTTFARRLSLVLGIDTYSTDDFYWKTKFTEKQDPQISLEALENIYRDSFWIVEGATTSLIKGGLEKADVIFNLEFETLFSQWLSIFKRHLGRKEERLRDLVILFRHVFYTRYGFGYKRGALTIRQLLHPYSIKVITLSSYRDINQCLESFEK